MLTLPSPARRSRAPRSTAGQPKWRSYLWVFWASVITVWSALLATVAINDAGNARLINLMATLTTLGMIAGAIGWGITRRRAHNRYAAELVKWSADRAAISERLAVARDLHDLVSNGLGAITMRAAAARLTASSGLDDDAADAFAEIEQTSRQATLELRHMLTILRATDGMAIERNLTADLQQIIATNRRNGLDIVCDEAAPTVLGDAPITVQMAACAVVREGLTNVLRHCGPSRVELTVERPGNGFVISIRDDGVAPGHEGTSGTGLGLAGLRERLAALGGTLSAMPSPESGGWLLTAFLPDGAAV